MHVSADGGDGGPPIPKGVGRLHWPLHQPRARLSPTRTRRSGPRCDRSESESNDVETVPERPACGPHGRGEDFDQLGTVVNLSREIRSLSSDPVEWAVSLRERWAERTEQRAKRSHSPIFMPWPPCPYVVDDEWEGRLHEAIGASWPCPAHQRFHGLWTDVISSVRAQVADVGRGVFGKDGWADGDTALSRVVYCLTLHLEPEHLLETGVARGITSRFILEAIAENGHGHLWSIDLPPPGESEIHREIGIAVPDRLRSSWTYVSGSSRRRLRSLLSDLQTIDLFVHDSKHTERNLLFELEHAWDALTSRGAVIVDDVDLNCGFHVFRRTHPDAPSFIGRAEPLRPDIGRQDDAGVVAVALRRRGPDQPA